MRVPTLRAAPRPRCKFSNAGSNPVRIDLGWVAPGQLGSIERFSDLTGTTKLDHLQL